MVGRSRKHLALRLRAFVVSSVVSMCLSAIACGDAAGPVGDEIRYGEGRQLSTLENRRITESSGLACSRRNEGVFWTHNDSGDKPRVYAFNRKGENLAVFTVRGAKARDWEDMASFTIGRKHYLLLADIGDNRHKRKSYTLYIIEEPKLDTRKRNVKGQVEIAQTIEFTYEDGPHDCESVAVDPIGRTILLVTKSPKRTVYQLPLPKKTAEKTKPLTAKPIANLMLFWTTGMDVSPDGRRAVVLTYAHARQYVRKSGKSWADAFARKPQTIFLPARPQGESICYGPDGKTLYLTSEKLPTPLIEVPVLKKKQPSARKKAR